MLKALKPLKSDPLTKSKFVHGMQCPLYLWLEVRTDAPVPEVSPFTEGLFAAGNQVGELACQLWDQRLAAKGLPAGIRVTDDPREHEQAVQETREALASQAGAIYEAAFTYAGIKVRVDVLERLDNGTYALHEVKSTSKYDEKKHLLDAAVQLRVVRGAKVPVSFVGLVHLNKGYEWPGGDYDLEQLFTEENLTEQAMALQGFIGENARRLLAVLKSDTEPDVPEDVKHTSPYPCPYLDICPQIDHSIEHPISELPDAQMGKGMHKAVTEAGFESLLDLREKDAERLLRKAKAKDPSPKWMNTWRATVTGERIVLSELADWIGALEFPLRHFDFETVGAPLPIIEHTHPFEVVPLQYSIHLESETGAIEHLEHMAQHDDLNPRKSLIEQMLEELGDSGDIIHWSPYEATVIKHLALNPRYAQYRSRLEALLPRLKDLGGAVRDGVFDKDFHGRWSIKKVYPVLLPGNNADHLSDEQSQVLSYDGLEGVAQGDEAALMLLEYMMADTSPERREDIRKQLLEYCQLDTWATVEVLRILREECGL